MHQDNPANVASRPRPSPSSGAGSFFGLPFDEASRFAGNSPPSLSELRGRLRALDEHLAHAICQRQRLVDAIGDAKRRQGRPLRDVAREQATLQRVGALAREQGVSADVLERVYRVLITASLRRQHARSCLAGPADERPDSDG